MSKIVCYVYDSDARSRLQRVGINLDQLEVPKAEEILKPLGQPLQILSLKTVQYSLNWSLANSNHWHILVEVSE